MKNLRTRELLAAAFAAALALGATSPARALDEDVMRNILSPVFLAKNLTAVCAQLDQDFLEQTKGLTGDANEVTDHIKNEVAATMTREEAAPIINSAAGAARAVGLGLIRALSGGSFEEQTDRVKVLCERTARPFVKGVVDDHEARHEFFEKMLKDARQG